MFFVQNFRKKINFVIVRSVKMCLYHQNSHDGDITRYQCHVCCVFSSRKRIFYFQNKPFLFKIDAFYNKIEQYPTEVDWICNPF